MLRIITRNLEEPVSIRDDDFVWIIPTHAIRALRLRDPDVKGEDRPFGFTMRAG